LSKKFRAVPITIVKGFKIVGEMVVTQTRTTNNRVSNRAVETLAMVCLIADFSSIFAY
jgi:hypothetical protein